MNFHYTGYKINPTEGEEVIYVEVPTGMGKLTSKCPRKHSKGGRGKQNARQGTVRFKSGTL